MILICSKTDQVSLWPNRMGPHLANAPNRNSLSKRADIDIFFITFLTIAPIRRLCRRRGCYATYMYLFKYTTENTLLLKM